MENMEIKSAYINSDGRVQIDPYIIIVSLWNRYAKTKIFKNNEVFFKNTFDNPYDAAYAVSAGNYQWADAFVYIDTEGHLMSFSLLDDETCPIDMDKIAIGDLIQSLQDVMAQYKLEVKQDKPVKPVKTAAKKAVTVTAEPVKPATPVKASKKG